MAHNPISRDPIRCPPDFLPFVTFAWPGGADPLGHIGQNSPATSYSVAPKRYSAATSNSPIGAGVSFTLAAVITVSAAIPTGVSFGHPVDTSDAAAGHCGVSFAVGSGQAWMTIAGSGGGNIVTLQPTFQTTVGRTFTMIGVHNSQNYTALFLDGTLASSSASTASWTAQHTFNLGWDGGTATWSGGLRDVYLFARAFTADEVGVLHQAMKV